MGKDIIKFIKENFVKFIKFGIVGVVNTCTSLVVYYILLFFGVHYLIGNTCGFVISSLVGFILNKTLVFKKKDETKKSLVKYYLLYISSYIINMVGLYIIVDKLGISDKIAPIILLCITVPYNYIGSNFWVFKNKKEMILSEEDKNLHTFVICAYKESQYLEDCVKSVVNQEFKTNIIMTTSTPNEYIENIAKKYDLKLYIKTTKSDICDDWNFGYNIAKTDLVTIAHQDDVYEPHYSKEIVQIYKKYSDAILLHTAYFALKNNKKTVDINCRIKRILQYPLTCRTFAKFKFFKVASLAFGNSINCPSVTYNKKIIGDTVFTSDLKFGLDWDTFLKFARQKGRFIYINKPSISYRIHDEATSKEFIENNKRIDEDIIMFNKIWPNFITKIIMKFYKLAYGTYKEDK